ncbi:putative DUF221 domain protein [Aspergillus clavatus NRRL 1]|uniref:DUF221 domain protein, putative n=1 Tax=Aspergillus clavatus (strain ATCC 1007 / CBS 513.65 / DSM 816 / NCTC 3887 / NRRL 1 / QM 1276 / 107) TaxID=344612 RepID=A1CKR7_ASPCL|nr:DUF221 domain protein, putative [Aspergillus clavatus NRRL 1]EAW09741.1 DUF221 domain protein, putative [Aspergillus clavatus NRRL 1]
MDYAALRQRDDPSSAEKFLQLIQNPFKSAFQINAVWASLGASAGISVLLALLFSLFRPHHSLVYAPKVKHADRRHTPPPVGKGFFAWIRPVLRTREPQLVECIGLDATIFLRFTKMCRNIFIILSIIGCGVMIPVNITQSNATFRSSLSAFATMTPLYVTTEAIWSQVICAWLFNGIIAFFLWRNYKAVTALRRKYFQSRDYQHSLHSRTLMITDIPNEARSDEALLRLVDGINPSAAIPRASIGRNVKDLPILIKEHEETVRQLESVLAKYLKRPNQLPAQRPLMRPSKKQRGDHPDCKVDAIDFLADRIQRLEEEIRHVRASIDKRNAMPFGFVSWEMIEHAHAAAYTARKKHPKGTTIRLSPRPNDLIWENLPLSKQTRKWRRFMNFIWVSLLTVVWIAPNALIAIFLSNLNNLGLVWPAFQTSLSANPGVWAAVQGILSPALTSLVYLVLPIIFRRLSIKAGDVSKTSRERHVLSNLYSFFVFNNLIVFSLFSAAWTFVAAVVDARNSDENAWKALQDGAFYEKVMSALCQVSPFWVTWLLQRNLGAAIDLVQLVTLFWVWFSKTFLAPTPRQAIEWTAPPSFEYASYYNYFLFYATVALCFATLQPIVLPVTALYFGLDAMLKKYLLLYVFVTKNESGGQFWRVLFNRLIFATILSDVVIALVAKTKGTWNMVYCVVPLPFLMLGFKFYCMRKFDDDIKYYNRANLTDAEAFAVGKSSKKPSSDRLNSKFGHPALYKPLITPMVHEKAAEVLKQIYRGRLNATDAQGEYSDIAMDPMSAAQPGKAMDASAPAPFEVVPESQLDFSFYKDRPDFRDEFGGGIYGRPEDLMTERSHTPKSHLAEWSPTTSRASSPTPSVPSLSGLRTHDSYEMATSDVHPAFRPPLSHEESTAMGGALYRHPSESESQQLLSQAQGPGTSDTSAASLGRWRQGGYGPVAQDDPPITSYELYRMPQ